MEYLFTPTAGGLNLLANLATGQKFKISRVTFGDGVLSEDPSALTSLVNPIADGTAGNKVVKANMVSFIVEYRSDLNGGLLSAFWLREFGIFALDKDNNEVLLYYANLGDKAQYVSAYTDGMVDIRRFPITVALSNDLEVVIIIDNLLILTGADLEAHNLDPTAHPDIRKILNEMLLKINDLEGRIKVIEESTIIGGVTFTADLVGLSNVTVANGVWNPASGSLSAKG
jgi:hypothetical protein